MSKTCIPHIEALDPYDFIDVIENITEYDISEKLDGSNLKFGFDNDYNFYTERFERVYYPEQYSDHSSNNGFRGAHAALKRREAQLSEILIPEDCVEIEVLFGRQPNAIVYGSNQIAFIRLVPSDEGSFNNDPNIIPRLTELLSGEHSQVLVSTTTTENGVTLKTEKQWQQWGYSAAPTICSSKFKHLKTVEELAEFKQWLSEKHEMIDMTHNELILAKLPSIKDRLTKNLVKLLREQLKQESHERFKLPIKEKILDDVLRVLVPANRDVEIEPHEDLGIEGIVLRKRSNGKQIKIVDKELFTRINQFNHAVRNNIKKTGGGDATFDMSFQKKDIFGKMLKDLSEVIGIEGLGSNMTLKRTLRRFIGNNIKETCTNVTNLIDPDDFKYDYGVLKNKIDQCVITSHIELNNAHTLYVDSWQTYRFNLKTGKTIQYTDAIHDRTLLSFAEVRADLNNKLTQIRKAETPQDLILALYGRTLHDIHS